MFEFKRAGLLVAIVALAIVVAGCASDDNADMSDQDAIAAMCAEGAEDCNDTPGDDLPDDVLPPNTDGEPTSGPDAADAVSVQQARDHIGSDPIVVNAFYLDDGESARLCEVSLESYPLQCGGASLTVTNPDLMSDYPLVEEGDIQWSEGFVVVEGTVSGDRFTIVGQ